MKPVYYLLPAIPLATIAFNQFQAMDDPMKEPVKYRAMLLSTGSTGALTVGSEVQQTIIGAPLRQEPPEEQKVTYVIKYPFK